MWVRLTQEVVWQGRVYKVGVHNLPSDVARDLLKAGKAYALRMDVPKDGPPRNGVERR